MHTNLIDGTFDFQLTKPIQYAFGGQARTGTFVTFFEPQGSHVGPALRLKNIYMAAFPKLMALADQMGGAKAAIADSALKKPHEATEADVSSDLGEMLLMIDSFDIDGFIAAFDKLVTTTHKHVAAKINNEQVFTASILDEISPEDHLNMAAAYVNFMQERSQARKSGTGSG